jgi:uncharacterized phage protein (TIGR01671 family)
MRKIEFRVWDSESEKWISPYRFMFDGDGGVWYYFHLFDKVIPTPRDRFITEQSTGFRDKNGKQIYEGDIVVNDSGYFPSGNWEVKYGVVEINASDSEINGMSIAGFYVAKKGHDKFSLAEFIEYGGVVIVGNIHDNPELLERKQ